MGSTKLTLEGVEYRGPEDFNKYRPGEKRYTAVLPRSWDSEWSDAPSMYEQVESSDTGQVGPNKKPVRIELEAVDERKAWIVFDPDSGPDDFNMLDYLESE